MSEEAAAEAERRLEERRARSLALEQAYVHDVYDRIARHFADTRYRPWPRVRQFLMDLEPGSLVVDVGCGNGKYLHLNPDCMVIGADRCSALLLSCRSDNGEVVRGDCLKMPFRDGAFDAALSVAVLHHLATAERRVGALKELARLLRIGGRCLITVWASEQGHRRFDAQDVLVPWHEPVKSSSEDRGSSVERELTSTTTSDDDVLVYHAYSHISDGESPHAVTNRKRLRARNGRGRYLTSHHAHRNNNSSQSSSELSSPNETCYSFVRRAFQKLSSASTEGLAKKNSPPRPYFYRSCRRPCVSDSMEFGSKGNTEENGSRKEIQKQDSLDADCPDLPHEDDIPIEIRHLEAYETCQTCGSALDHASCTSCLPTSEGKKSRSLGDFLNMIPRLLRVKKCEKEPLQDLHKRISTASDPREYVVRTRGLAQPNGIVRSKSTLSFMSRLEELMASASLVDPAHGGGANPNCRAGPRSQAQLPSLVSLGEGNGGVIKPVEGSTNPRRYISPADALRKLRQDVSLQDEEEKLQNNEPPIEAEKEQTTPEPPNEAPVAESPTEQKEKAESGTLSSYYSMPELYKLIVEQESATAERHISFYEQAVRSEGGTEEGPDTARPTIQEEAPPQRGLVKRSLSVDTGDNSSSSHRVPRRFSASAAQGALSSALRPYAPLPRSCSRGSSVKSDTSVDSEESVVSVVSAKCRGGGNSCSVTSDTSVDSEESVVSVIQRSTSEVDALVSGPQCRSGNNLSRLGSRSTQASPITVLGGQTSSSAESSPPQSGKNDGRFPGATTVLDQLMQQQMYSPSDRSYLPEYPAIRNATASTDSHLSSKNGGLESLSKHTEPRGSDVLDQLMKQQGLIYSQSEQNYVIDNSANRNQDASSESQMFSKNQTFESFTRTDKNQLHNEPNDVEQLLLEQSNMCSPRDFSTSVTSSTDDLIIKTSVHNSYGTDSSSENIDGNMWKLEQLTQELLEANYSSYNNEASPSNDISSYHTTEHHITHPHSSIPEDKGKETIERTSRGGHRNLCRLEKLRNPMKEANKCVSAQTCPDGIYVEQRSTNKQCHSDQTSEQLVELGAKEREFFNTGFEVPKKVEEQVLQTKIAEVVLEKKDQEEGELSRTPSPVGPFHYITDPFITGVECSSATDESRVKSLRFSSEVTDLEDMKLSSNKSPNKSPKKSPNESMPASVLKKKELDIAPIEASSSDCKGDSKAQPNESEVRKSLFKLKERLESLTSSPGPIQGFDIFKNVSHSIQGMGLTKNSDTDQPPTTEQISIPVRPSSSPKSANNSRQSSLDESSQVTLSDESSVVTTTSEDGPRTEEDEEDTVRKREGAGPSERPPKTSLNDNEGRSQKKAGVRCALRKRLRRSCVTIDEVECREFVSSEDTSPSSSVSLEWNDFDKIETDACFGGRTDETVTTTIEISCDDVNVAETETKFNVFVDKEMCVFFETPSSSSIGKSASSSSNATDFSTTSDRMRGVMQREKSDDRSSKESDSDNLSKLSDVEARPDASTDDSNAKRTIDTSSMSLDVLESCGFPRGATTSTWVLSNIDEMPDDVDAVGDKDDQCKSKCSMRQTSKWLLNNIDEMTETVNCETEDITTCSKATTSHWLPVNINEVPATVVENVNPDQQGESFLDCRDIYRISFDDSKGATPVQDKVVTLAAKGSVDLIQSEKVKKSTEDKIFVNGDAVCDREVSGASKSVSTTRRNSKDVPTDILAALVETISDITSVFGEMYSRHDTKSENFSSDESSLESYAVGNPSDNGRCGNYSKIPVEDKRQKSKEILNEHNEEKRTEKINVLSKTNLRNSPAITKLPSEKIVNSSFNKLNDKIFKLKQYSKKPDVKISNRDKMTGLDVDSKYVVDCSGKIKIEQQTDDTKCVEANHIGDGKCRTLNGIVNLSDEDKKENLPLHNIRLKNVKHNSLETEEKSEKKFWTHTRPNNLEKRHENILDHKTSGHLEVKKLNSLKSNSLDKRKDHTESNHTSRKISSAKTDSKSSSIMKQHSLEDSVLCNGTRQLSSGDVKKSEQNDDLQSHTEGSSQSVCTKQSGIVRQASAEESLGNPLKEHKESKTVRQDKKLNRCSLSVCLDKKKQDSLDDDTSQSAPCSPRTRPPRQRSVDEVSRSELSRGSSLSQSTSQESLPGGGGTMACHRYYHVFRQGELDDLIESHVDSLHIISSYYDHANWCVIAEKVQVWTI
ncbi:uncharacterized protein LOC129224772 [Uloborus diversus]|uniref:uncharacterized protein LOC129224772 n=1 Tax=Uloborus diversus TaxID=327109 RepID=UPI00240A7F01|nr:uncharacterized protein LOC129224772 [Uloborus diversus]